MSERSIALTPLMRSAPLLAALAAGACVPAHAGYAEVQRLGVERLGVKPVWHQAESAHVATSSEVKKLLATPLTADAAVRVAILNSPSLQGSFEDLGGARAGLVHALRVPNPVASAALRFDGSTRPEIDLSVSEDVTELLYIASRRGIAQAELNAATITVVGSLLALAYDVRAAFYRHQAARQLAELRASALSSLKASAEVAESLHTAGNITDLDLSNEQALYEEARLAFAGSETELVASRERLSSLMGLFGADAAWTAGSRLPELPAADTEFEDLERRSIANSLDLALIRHRFEAAARKANLSRWRGALPELKAGVSAERQSDWSIGPLVELELPLFYQGQGETGTALSDMRRQERNFEDVAIRLRAAARATAARLSAARGSAAHYRNVLLPLRARILEASEAEYNAMGIGVFQLLEAKRAQIQAGGAFVELLRDYWLARADAEQLLAGRLPRSDLGAEQLVREGAQLERGRGGLGQH
ncbi:MAG TPA: TolC family protein [Polyangiaceae bacterium]|nr:TolC family protein [Polyangiaceae bacterium]